MPQLADDYFAGTIVYLCEHNAEGAMGLVVNRPSEMTFGELLDQLGLPIPPAVADRPVLEGGPVAPERGFILHDDDSRFEGSLAMGPGLMLSASQAALAALAEGRGPRRWLVALGFAGWGPGQLEKEILENVWLNCPVDPAVLFDTPFEARVARAAAGLGIDFNLLSGHAGHA